MGRDKALLEVDGRALIERVLDALRPVVGAVFLACGSTPRYEHLGLPCVLDASPDRGPLGGLLAALEALETDVLVALGCDMPDLDSAVLEELTRFAQEGGWDVTLLGTEAGVEPLCAVYRRECLSAVRAAVARGATKLTSFHDEAIDGRPLRVTVMRGEHYPPRLRSLAARAASNLNTPADLARARARDGSRLS